MADLETWWNGVSEEDQTLFLQYRDTSPLPADVVARFQATGQLIAGARWTESNEDYTFNWPSWVQKFLQEKADDAND